MELECLKSRFNKPGHSDPEHYKCIYASVLFTKLRLNPHSDERAGKDNVRMRTSPILWADSQAVTRRRKVADVWHPAKKLRSQEGAVEPEQCQKLVKTAADRYKRSDFFFPIMTQFGVPRNPVNWVSHITAAVVSQPARDPAVVERTNLLNMAKLSIKGLIESSLSYGRTLDSDYPPLQQFFVVMEHCLKHGLKVRKSFLSFNRTIWCPLEMVEKICPEAEEVAASVRDLPGLRTPLGRARAWLRLSMMQKKLADYLRCLIMRRDILSEFYENHAVMMEEEGTVIVGLLVGLNVIDANLCVKGEDLDSQVGVIDFSIYLKSEEGDHNREGRNVHISAILDQKNYVEELNRQLKSHYPGVTIPHCAQLVNRRLFRNHLLLIPNLEMRDQETLDSLIESVTKALKLEEEPLSKTDHAVSFKRTKRAHKVFATHPEFKEIVESHRIRPYKRFTGQKSMELKYPFVQDLRKDWSQSPPVDPPVSRMATKFILSSPEGTSIKNPIDRQIDNMARSAFEASAAALFPSFAATWVDKAMTHWAEVLSALVLDTGHPPEIADLATQIARAGDFVVIASLDTANCASQAAANAITIRRSLWLRDWRADSTSKKSLTSISGQSPFWRKARPISDATGGKSKFQQQRPFRPFRNQQQQARSRFFFASTQIGPLLPHPLDLAGHNVGIEVLKPFTNLPPLGEAGLGSQCPDPAGLPHNDSLRYPEDTLKVGGRLLFPLSDAWLSVVHDEWVIIRDLVSSGYKIACSLSLFHLIAVSRLKSKYIKYIKLY
ncbi:unnamed protein product [Ranitomeya imitator]|uniref:RUN domain-containing protein n=1 Tax=Ranitomeya imitator TaxID=111125 RepID=A0ABN9M9D0_9NEOB|nr:unnamed protein product [Ranitomeya imitator]